MGKVDFSELRKGLSRPDALITDLAGHDEYLHDATEFRASPLAVLRAYRTEDVVLAVSFARQHGLSITARGAGTGLSGGCVASPNGLILSTADLLDMEIDPNRRIAVCGAGVITKDLQDAAADYGLTYLPDPASYAECTLGGNVAEGAGGLRCKRFGVTKDYVEGIEAVLPDGSRLRTGVFADYRGLSLGDVLIGSEGTLAVVTRIAVRLSPIPARGATILAAFSTMTDAARTVTDITTSGLIPTVLEFIDGDAAACANAYERSQELEDAGSVLLMETSGENAAEETARITAMCEKNRAVIVRTEADPDRAEALWKVRRNLSKAVRDVAGFAVSEDVVVPNSRFPDLVSFVSRLNASSPLRINSFGHVGDGNLHVYFISESGSQEDLHLIADGIRVLMEETVRMGGTLTGEHGIGLAKREFLGLEFDPPTLDAMRAVKEVFDPRGLLNPDKLFMPDA
jgi:glycolate oxidase subunit GlcD